MTKIEKVFEDPRTIKLLERVLMREFCPAFFGLKNNCDTATGDCEKCWNQEVAE